MSYTPTTWNTGDTITATKLNKIEQGIANSGSIAIVKIQWNFNGSVGVHVGTTEGIPTGQDFYSLNAIATEHFGGGYYPRMYIPVVLPDDGNNSVIIFNEYTYLNYNIVGTGGVSSTPVVARYRSGASAWQSSSEYVMIVTGDGTITVTPK